MGNNRCALIVGINEYLETDNLHNAVTDAESMKALLHRHQDGTINYECRLLCDTMEDGRPITRGALRQACQELFLDCQGEILFYFSGHGFLDHGGGYIATYDATVGDWGLSMQEIIDLADQSPASDILIILDCCHSGALGNSGALRLPTPGAGPLAVLRENMTIMAASQAPQNSVESGGHGCFTAALIDALDGGAADHLGWVTAPSMYAYANRRFGGWGQHPVYKTHATSVNVVRQCAPLIERLKLRELVKYFPTVDHKYQLDPEYEPEKDEKGRLHEPVNHAKVAIAHLFKDYRDAGLLKPTIPGEQLYWTAKNSHTVELTPRGREYWMLVKNDRI